LSYFLALFSSEDKTIVYLVDRTVVNKEVDKEVDDKTVRRGVFKQVLLAKKLVIGLNNYIGH
jgi:hypothetical protein